MSKKYNIILILHPNIAILDQWAPVIYHLRIMKPDVNIIGVTIRENKKVGIDKGTSSKRSLNYFNDYVDEHVQYYGYFARLTKRLLKSATYLLNKYFQSKWLHDVLEWVNDMFESIIFRISIFNNKNIFKTAEIILSDISYLNGREIQRIINTRSSGIVGCLPHGSGINVYKYNSNDRVNVLNRIRKHRSIALYVESKDVVDDYIENYNIFRDEIKVTGLTRFDSLWINYINKMNNNQVNYYLRNNYIYVTSRPTSSNLFTYEERGNCLKDVRDIASIHGLHVVIGLHPKESRLNTMNQLNTIFSSNSIPQYIIDEQPPYVGIKNAQFVVHFSTSMPYDSALLSVPSITYRQKRIRQDWPWDLTNCDGLKISPPEHFGFTLTAFDTDSFNSAVSAILRNRDDLGLAQNRALIDSGEGEGLTNCAYEISKYLLNAID